MIRSNYGDDWLMRTAANFTGIWANTQNEVIYFANGNASPLNGRDFSTATFTKNDRPDAHVQYFSSVTCVDAVNFRVIPNAKNRFLLNRQSQLEYGRNGSLTRYFAPQKPDDAPENNCADTGRAAIRADVAVVRTRSGDGGAEVVSTGAEEAMIMSGPHGCCPSHRA